MSWNSGPCIGPDSEPDEDRDEKQPRNPEPRWDIRMADSGTHWQTLRPGGNWPERKSTADDPE
jgi:hypothetical protein